jgi:hypothetical protein
MCVFVRERARARPVSYAQDLRKVREPCIYENDVAESIMAE